MYGLIEYDSAGKPKCGICGKGYHRLMTHVRQVHFMTALEYKQIFGLDVRRGIASIESKQKSREAVFNNYEKAVKENLINKGQKSRFQKGHEGRTKEKMSEQTKNRLKENLKTDKMKDAMKENGRRLGLSGLGNKKRWGKA